MSAWKDFGRLAVFAVAAVGPAAVFAGGFEEGILVTDRAETVVSPADAQVALPGESILVQPEEDVVVGPAFEPLETPMPAAASYGGEPPAPESYSVSCDQCGTVGCISCCDAGCTSCTVTDGCINRILGPANPRWVAQVDALMLWQANVASRPLYTDSATGLTSLDVNQAQPPMSAGPRYGLFFNLDDCYAIEGNYFDVQSFSAQRATPLTAGGYTMNNLAGLNFTGIDTAQVSTSGQIQSAELNWRRRQCGLPITWLAGFRWVQWNQRLQVTDEYSTPSPGVDTVNVITGNDLYGGQAGMDLGLWNSGGRFTVNGIGKAGIFYNTAYQRTDISTQPAVAPAAAIAEQTAFFGEVGVNSSLRLTKWLSWRAGYSVFWLSGVAIPANQLSLVNQPAPNDVATINTNGSVLLHGVTTGLEARW